MDVKRLGAPTLAAIASMVVTYLGISFIAFDLSWVLEGGISAEPYPVFGRFTILVAGGIAGMITADIQDCRK